MPDAFTGATKVTRLYKPAVNALAIIDILEEKPLNMISNESSKARLKRGQPIGSKDSVPGRRRIKGKCNTPKVTSIAKGNTTFSKQIPEEAYGPGNKEFFRNYACTRELWERKEIVVNDKFSFVVAIEIMNENDLNRTI